MTCRWSVDPYLRNAETREDPIPISKEGGVIAWNRNFVGLLSDHRQFFSASFVCENKHSWNIPTRASLVPFRRRDKVFCSSL